MAKLDQSFIKAYGHVGARATASRAASAKPSSAAAESAVLPLLSAAPIVVDAGTFAADAPRGTACDAGNAANSRIEPVAVEERSSPPRPHFRRPSPTHAAADAEVSLPWPRANRRPPAKPESREAQSPDAAEIAHGFRATSFSVDTFVGKSGAVGEEVSNATRREMPAANQPLAKPKTTRPTMTRPTIPAARSQPDAASLCHRACTVQFSTTADVESVAGDSIERKLDASHELDLSAEPDDGSTEAPATEAPAPATEFPAPHVGGVAYRRMSARPASALRSGYEVDAFRWPPIVAGLAGRATTALSTLIDELVDASSSGRGVVMFAGERRGAGTTTLAAYAARRLAELGLSVALVDADFAKPTLARSVGVAVDRGWDEAVEAGGDFAAALIASLDDGVTMLPLRHPTANVNGAKAARIAADLAALRQHFALVVIDGGPLAEAEAWLSRAPEDTVDCGIVVRDVRIDAGQSSSGRPHAPRAAALPAIGVVENFVGETKTRNT